MSRLARRLATLFLLMLACALPAGSVQAADSTENIATAITEQDDSKVFDFAWDLSKERGDDPVLHLNQATARARCTRCGATAIAFQIVVVSGSPTTVVPVNTAEAVNVECTECTAIAAARQWVLVVPYQVRFTGEGRATLAAVRERLAALETQDLPVDQVYTVVEQQEARVRAVLADELVRKSDPSTEAKVLTRRVFQSTDLD